MKNRTKLPNIYIGVVTAVLYLPIVLVIIYSFNESKISSVWGGFSLKWYETLFRDAAMFEALGNSIVLALCASLGAAVIGTLGAYGFTKVQLRTKSAVEYVSMLPIMIPEIILGMVFMTFFALIGLPFGMTTLILAHTVFCIPYIYMLVKARLVGMDKSLAEAARDLGAGEVRVFFDITLPLLVPAILSGMLLSFAMSLDDVIISIFVTGVNVNTLPIKVYTQIKTGVTPEINALSTLMLAGIRDILIISTPTDLPNFERLLGDGSRYGVNLSYAEQPSPDGLAQAFILGEEFIGDDCCAMVLGDNIFYGAGFSKRLKNAAANAANGRSTVFGYYVNDPERFGVVAFDKDGHATDIEEKPANPKSNYAVTGLYFYNSDVVKMAKQVKPSARGELEITTLNQMYLDQGKLDVQLLGRGYAWLDTGTMDSLVEAATFVQTVEQRQGIKISAPEEIAYKYGWITKEKLLESAARYGKSPYGQHLKNVADDKLQY